MILVFFTFNQYVEKRQTMVLDKAVHSTAIISSLFPKQVRDRLLETDDNKNQVSSGNRWKMVASGTVSGNGHIKNGSPIADLFPECTVLFADIAGFTAWSRYVIAHPTYPYFTLKIDSSFFFSHTHILHHSTRAPEQVFILLQAIYQEYDQVARRRKVFKVETVGDCYLAATG
jgi:Adenylate and Guanylate cyclase catalytic domain